MVAITTGVWLVAAMDTEARGRVDVVVYVTSQGLFYDSVVNTDLPPHGKFQLLEPGGPEGTLMTEFGPGDPGYRGGRWMMDTDGDGEIDKYFSCPLLGPGRDSP
ncbi:MAG: hypothetical protein IID32_07290 [Planctomycetes bacterium]|nr:hypothetical protein [Planctomycetota bacterium]